MALLQTIDQQDIHGIRVGRRYPGGGYGLTGSCIIYQHGDSVIDTGPANQWKFVRDYLQHYSIRQALITHYHEDHSGNAGHFHSCFGCNVLSHPEAHSHLRDGIPMNWVRRVFFGRNAQVEPASLPDQIDTGNGELQSLNLKGHSPDSMSFFDAENGRLYSGDLYVASRIAYMQREESIGGYIDSLNQALALDFDTLCCAHRGIINDGKTALRKKRDYIENLAGTVEQLHQAGKNSQQITLEILGREDMRTYLSGGLISKHNVVLSCLDYLDRASPHSQ
ncbi:Hydroxyacylglutathione hydrolase [BD1-7 clade bacterium]|uniref:Hydroxyacylglutathione hydrolase n=1 Tax=BD1-7 clade bacterium TaxID=2029982 RepID=A0A5S9R1P0_9GAMM|nr:Hydroxyacylglutathione hydrolase [BD1-7 clade bacterium]